MNNEEKFKKLLHEKLDAKDFPFEMKHWDSMRVTIDKSRDNRSRKAVLLFLCLACILGTVGLYLYTGPPVKEIASTETLKTDPAPAIADNQGDVVSSAVKKEGTKKQAIAKNQVNAFVRQTTQSVATEKLTQEKTLVTGQTFKEPARAAQKVIEKVNTGNTLTKPVEEPPLTVTEPAAEKFETPIAPVSAKTEEPKTESSLTPKTDEGVINRDGVAVNEPISPVEVQPAVTQTIANSSDPLGKDSVSLNGQKVADLILPLEDNLIKNSIYLEGGANYLAGWKIDDKKDGNGFNPVAGISYQYAINRRYAVSTGLHYTSVRNLSIFSHQSEETTYGFGAKKEITVITPEKIHYLQIPVKFNVLLNAKNIVGAGYTFGYLLTVNSKVEKYSDGNGAGSSPVVSKATGYTQGFNKYDSQVSIFYRRLLYKKIYLNAEALYGLSDAKKNSFFSSSAMERNMGLKITIMYNIFQK